MVTVPAGILAAYKVKFDLGAMAPKMYAWYGKGTPHYLVKYDNGRIRCELKDTR